MVDPGMVRTGMDGPRPSSAVEALKAFSKGTGFGSPTENLVYIKRALELDPNFAIGYAELGAAYMNVGARTLGAENIRKAFELRERASQRERFYIEATYYGLLTRELEKAEHPVRSGSRVIRATGGHTMIWQSSTRSWSGGQGRR
jgi:hypothetical protein